MVSLVDTADALIAVSESILGSIDDLNKVEYNKKGRKYRFVQNIFQRVREEDKHLVIYPEHIERKAAVISSYYILSQINGGSILSDFKDLCLAIVGVANKLETKGWYEEENSSVVHIKYAKYNPMEVKDEALAFFEEVTEAHIHMGLNLMICSKLNFLHTDHHIGTKVEGYHMRNYINEYFGEEALDSHDVLIALKSFVHWGNIKGILYKLEVPDILITPELKASFDDFPEPIEELKNSVYDRYPSGTSKYSLIRKSIDILGDWQFSKLIPFPSGEQYDLNWLYSLCHDIEANPIRFHLRSSTKLLCANPVSLNDISNKYSGNIKSLLNLISLIINIFNDTEGDFLLQNSKIPKFNEELVKSNIDYYNVLQDINENIENYKSKGWDADDIVLRLYNEKSVEKSLFDVVMNMREKYIADYE